jgi:hypothetical protein
MSQHDEERAMSAFDCDACEDTGEIEEAWAPDEDYRREDNW